MKGTVTKMNDREFVELKLRFDNLVSYSYYLFDCELLLEAFVSHLYKNNRISKDELDCLNEHLQTYHDMFDNGGYDISPEQMIERYGDKNDKR